LQHGIVSRVTAPDELDEAALTVGRLIAGRSPMAVRMARQVLASLATPAVESSMHEEWLAQSVVMGERRKGAISRHAEAKRRRNRHAEAKRRRNRHAEAKRRRNRHAEAKRRRNRVSLQRFSSAGSSEGASRKRW